MFCILNSIIANSIYDYRANTTTRNGRITNIGREREESIYKRDLKKRIELINWVLENMKNPHTNICALIETRTNNIIDKINETDSIIEADPLDSEVRILEWILYVVYSNEMNEHE